MIFIRTKAKPYKLTPIELAFSPKRALKIILVNLLTMRELPTMKNLFRFQVSLDEWIGINLTMEDHSK